VHSHLEISQDEYAKISTYIRENYGISLSEKKRTFIISRLGNIVKTKGFNTINDYFEHIQEDKTGNTVIEMINKLTTNYTYFYREHKHFEYMKNIVLPSLVKKEALSKDMRIWSAGCATGEEPYTLQMIIKDVLRESYASWNTDILATDISTNALAKAREGVYPNEAIDKMPPEWKNKYFQRLDEDNSIIKNEIKSRIIFKRFNLMDPFPFKRRLHVIFCRNVMIYFDAETKNKLVDKFYEMMEPGGYLFIGHAESIDRNASRYNYIQPAVYRKEEA